MPEITMEDVKKAVEEQGKSNDARLKAFDIQIEDIKKTGAVSAETKERLDKITADLAALESIKAMPAKLLAIEAALKRSGQAKDKDGKDMPDDHAEAKAAHEAFIRQGDGAGADNSWRYAKHNPKMGVKSLSVQSDPDGGYMVLHDLSGRIVKKVFETSNMRALASIQTIGTDALDGIYDDDQATSGGWVGETASRLATATPKIGKWVIPAHEQFAYPFATQKFLDDANIDVESWLGNKVGDILARTENTAFISGSGQNQPKGIASYPAGTTLRTQIEQVNTGVSADVSYAGLVKIQMALKTPYRNVASWGMARTTIQKVMLLVDGYSRPLWLPSMIMGMPSLLLGSPIAELNDLAAPSAGSLSIAWADWKEAYQIVDRIGVRILRNPFATLGQVGYYTTKRTGGDVINTEAIKIGKLT